MESTSTFTGLNQVQTKPKVSILVTSRNRANILGTCLESALNQDYEPIEVLLLDDNSSQYRLDQLMAERFKDTRLRCFRTDISLGVAGGRNFLMEQATGDIFCVIDDDAGFIEQSSISTIVDAFSCHSKIGVAALKIIDYQDDQARILAPFSQYWRKKQPNLIHETQLVSYYIGCGHAIKRQVFEQCRGYQQNLMFGEEELDFSYQVIAKGFEIIYLPTVVIHHHPQPPVVSHKDGYRQPELYYHVRNRFFISYKYLPWIYVPIYLMVWLSRYGLHAFKSRALKEFFDGVVAGIKMLKALKRTPLNPQSIQYLKANYGRLWY